MVVSKFCNGCKTEKAAKEFPVNPTGQLRFRCKTCWNKYTRKRKPREKVLEYERKIRKDPSKRWRWILMSCRAHDKHSGFERGDLDKEFVCSEITKGCSYCEDQESLMTLDRVDNNLGHTKNNVVPACVRCNYLRRDMPIEAWLEIAPSVRSARIKGLFGSWIGDAKKRKRD